MPNKIIFNKRISNFNKKIIIPGDKSLSIRWVLISSLSDGVSKAKNLLFSEDVLAAIEAIRKLGIKVIVNNKMCKIFIRRSEEKVCNFLITFKQPKSTTFRRVFCSIRCINNKNVARNNC